MSDMCALVEAKVIRLLLLMLESFFASVVHYKVLEISSLCLALHKDHFDV